MNIVIESYPLHSRINSKLYNAVTENIIPAEQEEGSLVGRRTNWDLHNKEIKSVTNILAWIKYVASNCMHKFATKKGEDKCVGQFNRQLDLIECWGIVTNKGDSLDEHNHFPYTLSFVYGVRMPRGSASIIINNKRVKYGEGDLVLFPAWMYHKVNRNNVNDRCSIAGNFLYSVDKHYT